MCLQYITLKQDNVSERKSCDRWFDCGCAVCCCTHNRSYSSSFSLAFDGWCVLRWNDQKQQFTTNTCKHLHLYTIHCLYFRVSSKTLHNGVLLQITRCTRWNHIVLSCSLSINERMQKNVMHLHLEPYGRKKTMSNLKKKFLSFAFTFDRKPSKDECQTEVLSQRTFRLRGNMVCFPLFSVDE